MTEMADKPGLVVRTDNSDGIVRVVIEQAGKVIDSCAVPIGVTPYPRIAVGLVNQAITGMRRYAGAARLSFEVQPDVLELLKDLGSKLDGV